MAVFNGTESEDLYLATSEGDRVVGVGGNDTLVGNTGRDALDGGAGNDLLLAGSGNSALNDNINVALADDFSAKLNVVNNDTLSGGEGNDTLVGAQTGFSDDLLTGNIGNDLLISANNGGNILVGGQGDDTIYGSLQNGNTMNGSSGNDLLVAGLGNDTLIGGIGNDILVGGIGNDILVGGDDIDEFEFLSRKENTLSVLVGTEQILRSDGGFGGSDIISDFSLGDRIAISELARDAVVTVTNDSFGAAVITIVGVTGNGQSAAQTITVLGIPKEQLLAPGSQAFAIFDNLITTANTNNVDGISTFTISG